MHNKFITNTNNNLAYIIVIERNLDGLDNSDNCVCVGKRSEGWAMLQVLGGIPIGIIYAIILYTHRGLKFIQKSCGIIFE